MTGSKQPPLTIDIHETSAMTNQTFRRLEQIPHADAKTDVLNDLV